MQLPVAPVVVKVIVQVAGGVVEVTVAVLPLMVPVKVIVPLSVVSVNVTAFELPSAWRTGPRVMSADT